MSERARRLSTQLSSESAAISTSPLASLSSLSMSSSLGRSGARPSRGSMEMHLDDAPQGNSSRKASVASVTSSTGAGGGQRSPQRKKGHRRSHSNGGVDIVSEILAMERGGDAAAERRGSLQSQSLLDLSKSVESLDQMLAKPVQRRRTLARKSLQPLDDCVLYSDPRLADSLKSTSMSNLADDRLTSFNPLPDVPSRRSQPQQQLQPFIPSLLANPTAGAGGAQPRHFSHSSIHVSGSEGEGHEGDEPSLPEEDEERSATSEYSDSEDERPAPSSEGNKARHDRIESARSARTRTKSADVSHLLAPQSHAPQQHQQQQPPSFVNPLPVLAPIPSKRGSMSY